MFADRQPAQIAAMPASGAIVRWGPPLLVVIVALVARLHGLGAKPLWHDEAWSVLISRSSIAATIDAVRHDFHPPLYYISLHLWQELGAGVAWVRLLSVLFGSGAALLIYHTGRYLGGSVLGIAAGLFLATAPLHVEWAQAARGYAVLDFAVALAVWGAVRILVRRRSEPAPAWAWVAYVLGGTMAIWIHNLAALFLIGINVAAFVHWILGWRCDRALAMRWIAAQVAVVVLFLPWVPFLLAQLGMIATKNGQHFLVGTWGGFRQDIAWTFGVAMLWGLGKPAFVVTAVLAAWGMLAGNQAAGGARVVSVTVLTPVILSAALFAAGVALFGEAIGKIVWIGIPYSLAVGAGVLAVERSWCRRSYVPAAVGGLLVAALIVMQAQGLRNLYDSPNPAWDAAASTTAQQVRPGDVVMDSTDDPAHSYNYYLEAAGLNLPHVYPAADVDDLAAWLGQYRRIWVPIPVPPMANRLPAALEAAKRAGLTVAEWRYRSVTLHLVSSPGQEGSRQ